MLVEQRVDQVLGLGDHRLARVGVGHAGMLDMGCDLVGGRDVNLPSRAVPADRDDVTPMLDLVATHDALPLAPARTPRPPSCLSLTHTAIPRIALGPTGSRAAS